MYIYTSISICVQCDFATITGMILQDMPLSAEMGTTPWGDLWLVPATSGNVDLRSLQRGLEECRGGPGSPGVPGSLEGPGPRVATRKSPKETTGLPTSIDQSMVSLLHFVEGSRCIFLFFLWMTLWLSSMAFEEFSICTHLQLNCLAKRGHSNMLLAHGTCSLEAGFP